jgi:hypothetical protein
MDKNEVARSSKKIELRTLYIQIHHEFWSLLNSPTLNQQQCANLAAECRKIARELDNLS